MQANLIKTNIDGIYLTKFTGDLPSDSVYFEDTVFYSIVLDKNNIRLDALKNTLDTWVVGFSHNEDIKLECIKINNDTYYKITLYSVNNSDLDLRNMYLKGHELFHLDEECEDFGVKVVIRELDYDFYFNLIGRCKNYGYTIDNIIDLLGFLGFSLLGVNNNISLLERRLLGVEDVINFIYSGEVVSVKLKQLSNVCVGYLWDKTINDFTVRLNIYTNTYMNVPVEIDDFCISYNFSNNKVYLIYKKGNHLYGEKEICSASLQDLIVGDIILKDGVLSLGINNKVYNFDLDYR